MPEKLKTKLKALRAYIFSHNLLVIAVLLVAIIITLGYSMSLNQNLTKEKARGLDLASQLKTIKSQDPYKKNIELEGSIGNIEKTYNSAVKTYEQILDAKAQKRDVSAYETSFAEILSLLSERAYSSASAKLLALNNKIAGDAPKTALSNEVGTTNNAPVSNTAPGSGYSRQNVHTDFGDFLVDIIAADLGSTRVIVDTASDSDCANNCPVMALGDYVGRSGAYAGVNGSYFCPAEYPSCAGKTNSFDTLLMNKNKVYFNSANNVYSTVPAVIFGGSFVRYVGQSLEWGRDTGVDGVIANHPLLVSNGQVVFGGNDEVKLQNGGSRSFVGSSGNTVYIGVVHNVNAAQMARVLQAMGIQNALNLDSGGSTALWSGGYRVGPGRNIPNAVLFVRK